MAASEDELTLAQVMLPEDANPRGNVHGGALMKLADTAGAVRPLEVTTPEQRRRWHEAEQRRAVRLRKH